MVWRSDAILFAFSLDMYYSSSIFYLLKPYLFIYFPTINSIPIRYFCIVTTTQEIGSESSTPICLHSLMQIPQDCVNAKTTIENCHRKGVFDISQVLLILYQNKHGVKT